jgi:hypothetical protein
MVFIGEPTGSPLRQYDLQFITEVPENPAPHKNPLLAKIY